MRRVLLFVVLSQAPESLAAQREPVVAPGSRVRVREMMESGRLSEGIEGRVDRVWGDSMSMSPRDGGPATRFANTSENHVLVWSGRRSSIPRGLVLGGVVGIVGGAVVGSLAQRDCYGNDFLCVHRRHNAITKSLIFGAIGSAGGLVVGALFPHDSWKRSRVFRPVRPAVRMGPDQFRLGLSLSF